MAEALQLPFLASGAPLVPSGGSWSTFGLRDYQVDACEAVLRELEERRSTLVVLPTGTGKTTVFGAIAARWPGRVFVLAHRRELVRQARDRMRNLAGELVGWEQADSFAASERLVSASVQTLTAKRRKRFAGNPPSLIIVDEAHHATSESYLGILREFPDARVLGVTATPDRFDQEALGQVFDSVAYKLEIEEAIDSGWLVPVRTARPERLEIDLSGVHKRAGDLAEDELAEVMEKHVRGIAEGTVAKCGSMQTIVFVPRVEMAHDLAAHLQSATGRPGCARAIDGKTPDDERDTLLGGFRKGEFQYLVNVGIATEGFDAPNATAVVIARPTMSRALFTQMVGRVLRPLAGVVDGQPTAEHRRHAIAMSGKPFALVVNFKYIAGRHTLVCPEDILGGEYTIEEREMARLIQIEDPETTVDEALKQAKDRVEEAKKRAEEERAAREARAAALRAKARIEWGEFNPFDAFKVLCPEHDYESDTPLQPASDKVKRFLRSRGVRIPANLTQLQASKLMKTIRARENKGLATLGQINWLSRHGVPDAHKWSYVRANQVMQHMQKYGRPPERAPGEEG